jgi:hypothetical protein
MKKTKLNAQKRELVAAWEALKVAQAKPLERGAIAKSVKGSTVRRKMPTLFIPPERDSRAFKSLDSGKGSTALPEAKQYSGNKVIGVAVLHKSCLQPIFNEEAAQEVAKMRR